MKPLIFFGTGNFSAASLQALIDQGWPIAAVVTQPDKPAGRGRASQPPIIKQLAGQQAIPVLQPATKTDILPALRPFTARAGVVVAYGKILPPEVIAACSDGLINVHASLLPKYRGPSPIEAAILNDNSKTGVTLMQITSQMDAGPIFASAPVQLSGRETRPQLYRALARLGAQTLVLRLEEILSGKLPPQAQDENQATYCQLITKQDGEIDWAKPAQQLEREVRAYLGWPGSYTNWKETTITVTAASVSPAAGPIGAPHAVDGQLAFYCAEGSLIVERLKPAGKAEMSSRDWLRGHPL